LGPCYFETEGACNSKSTHFLSPIFILSTDSALICTFRDFCGRWIWLLEEPFKRYYNSLSSPQVFLFRILFFGSPFLIPPFPFSPGRIIQRNSVFPPHLPFRTPLVFFDEPPFLLTFDLLLSTSYMLPFLRYITHFFFHSTVFFTCSTDNMSIQNPPLSLSHGQNFRHFDAVMSPDFSLRTIPDRPSLSY